MRFLLPALLFPAIALAGDGGMADGQSRALLQARNRHEIELFRDNFRLVDSTGQAWTLGGQIHAKRIVLVAWSPSCAAPANVLAWAQNRVSAAKRTDVALVFLDSDRPQDRGLVERIRPGATSAPVLMDYSQLVTKGFGFRRSGDFLVLDAANGHVTATGSAYADSLEDALRDDKPGPLERVRLATGRFLRHLRHPGPECELHFMDEGEDLRDDVADAVFRSCVACHLYNGAPNTFRSYTDLKQWHEMNRLVLRLHRMPPGGKDPESGECSSSPYYPDVTAADLSLVANWIEKGEPRSDPAIDPIARRASEYLARKRPAGAKPDISWTSPEPDRVPARGMLEYVYRQVGPFPKDLYLRAARLQFNPLTTHHVKIYLSPVPLPERTLVRTLIGGDKSFRASSGEVLPAKTMKDWTALLEWGNQPGERAARDGTVFFVPKGSSLIVEQHLESDGRAETNRTALGLFLDPHPEGKSSPRKIDFYFENFTIPPNRGHFELTKTLTVEEDSSILGAMVHGHFRLVRYHFRILYPDGRGRELCNVPYVQFTSNFDPQFPSPVFAPKGSRVEFHLIYDNSAANPLNPDPAASVPEGPFFLKNEMGIGQITTVPGRLPGAR